MDPEVPLDAAPEDNTKSPVVPDVAEPDDNVKVPELPLDADAPEDSWNNPLLPVLLDLSLIHI